MLQLEYQLCITIMLQGKKYSIQNATIRISAVYYNSAAGHEMFPSECQWCITMRSIIIITIMLQGKKYSNTNLSSVAGHAMLQPEFQLCITVLLQSKKCSNQNVRSVLHF